MKKIGIFAGTFDPVHDGHIAFARMALGLGLEKVMFLPEPRPRRKQGVKALEHRTAMVQIAVADEARFGTIVLEQARFTAHETLPVLKARFPGYKIVFLFGDDVVAHISGWPDAETLIKDTELIIASRHQNKTSLEVSLATLEKTTNLKFSYQIVEPEKEDITSSKIRHSVKQKTLPKGLNSDVYNYILKHHLYFK